MRGLAGFYARRVLPSTHIRACWDAKLRVPAASFALQARASMILRENDALAVLRFGNPVPKLEPTNRASSRTAPIHGSAGQHH